MTIELRCGQCDQEIIGTTPELDEGRNFPMMERPGVRIALIVDGHFAKTRHTAVSGIGQRTQVEVFAPGATNTDVRLSSVLLSSL